MKKILFVCHGNICRSPMAEYVFKEMAERAGMEEMFEVASAATSTEELGNPVYPPARRVLAEHGIGCGGHRAHQITRGEYEYYDMIICMDHYNLRNLRYVIGEDDLGKVSLLLDYTDNPHDVADPWYTDRFEECYDDILAGCKALLELFKACKTK